MMTPQKFVPVGYGNAVNANRVVGIVLPHSAAGKRHVQSARKARRYIDMTFGRKLKCALLLEDGSVVGCALTTKTIYGRFMASEQALVEAADRETAEMDDADDKEGIDTNEEYDNCDYE